MKKLLRLGLIGGGASSIVSAIVGVVSAFQLIEPSDAEAVGITPWDFVGFYAVIFLLGAGMIYGGWRVGREKKKPQASQR